MNPILHGRTNSRTLAIEDVPKGKRLWLGEAASGQTLGSIVVDGDELATALGLPTPQEAANLGHLLETRDGEITNLIADLRNLRLERDALQRDLRDATSALERVDMQRKAAEARERTANERAQGLTRALAKIGLDL